MDKASLQDKLPGVVTYRECNLCKESLKVIRQATDREIAFEIASGKIHSCWQSLPEDANLLILDED